MSILSTSSKLIKVGQDYSAGSGISIDDHVISVTGEFGKTYSAGNNVDIYEQDEQLYISSKDWNDDIAEASANAYSEAVAQIPDPFDPSYLSAQIDNKLNSSDFTTWQNGQYTTDLQTIEGQINNKLDTSSFSDVSGSFLTAHQSLEGYATEDWVTAQGYITGVDLSNYYTKDETSGKEELSNAFDNIPVGDPEVNAYVTDHSATINGTTDLVQNSSGLWNDVAVYQSNSANYLTAHQDISYKLDESAFADVSGTFLTAHQSLDGYATVEDVESATSGLFPSSAVSPLVSNIMANVVNYSDKPTTTPIYASYNTLGNVGQIVNQSGLSIIPSSVLQVPNVITAVPNYGLTAGGVLTADYNGLVCSGYYNNFSAKSNGLINSASDSYFSAGYNGLYNSGNYTTFSAANTGISLSSNITNFSAGIYGIYNLVDYIPSLFISGRSGKIDINLTGCSAVDGGGNKKWQIGEADHLWSFANGNPSYTGRPIVLCYAPQAGSANAPYFMAGPGGFTSEYIQNNNPMGLYGDFGQGIRYTVSTAKVTATLNMGDIRFTHYNDSLSANDIWSLTASVQKREIEYDADTSAITAIAGSAIGGGGVTGEFVPQSAFDELKQSYDALSSMLATYSGQWLLPNEGEE